MAIFLTTISYLLMAVAVGATVMRDASGDVADLVEIVNNTARSFMNQSIEYPIQLNEIKYGTHFYCENNHNCTYGGQNNFQVIHPFIHSLFLF